jgi:hypothetical protein
MQYWQDHIMIALETGEQTEQRYWGWYFTDCLKLPAIRAPSGYQL